MGDKKERRRRWRSRAGGRAEGGERDKGGVETEVSLGSKEEREREEEKNGMKERSLTEDIKREEGKGQKKE